MAMAVAENATTMPVITSACGTGSAASRPLLPAGNDAEQEEYALPRMLKATIFCNGSGLVIRPKRPRPTSAAPPIANKKMLFMAAASVLAFPPQQGKRYAD